MYSSIGMKKLSFGLLLFLPFNSVEVLSCSSFCCMVSLTPPVKIKQVALQCKRKGEMLEAFERKIEHYYLFDLLIACEHAHTYINFMMF